ncbi:protein translocase subunit SecA [Steroidobacter agaridevorans]|uniref:Protein translocase subunit SecA n=1 Tax=Steroidobacter agaridevorans TaxID=2695856 RepID=A0A829YDT1_9GAMM|nr:preprotein translocase subunit SecA [Steroidobacter agaridevorans]GFE81400.1 protein translocase subunit SecA [Steroidobacter agaridevorans]GFE88718.1 protein translocase subunit SecA [Steroidobacter agaridevorans]
MANWLTQLFGSRNQRLLSGYSKIVGKTNALEESFRALSDEQLQAKTAEFRQLLDQGKTLDDIAPQAFAATREAARRVLGMRHFDVQIIGGTVLHQGKIAEMRTGEGKTLMATLGAYLNALPAKGVHVVTVNEYLASRDADWMGRVYRFLGLTVGVIKSGQSSDEKRAAYACDITYGTNNEFGFDYLRDNLAFRLEDRVQRGLAYAIVDEVDSILIDEARTPLIISGPAEESTELYLRINELAPKLKRQESEEGEGDYWADEKSRQVHLSDVGHEHAEQLIAEAGLLQPGESLYDAANIRIMHHLNAALRAHSLYHRDVEYIVRNGEVIIVDEFTGRTMPGRRWSDGLHQAIEAKERVRVREENQTVASITFQNYFRMYSKLAGMTGTADTEAFEFQSIYGLEVVVIPTNKPMIRKDHPDFVYLTQKDKFEAIIEDIRDCVARGQPALVGTTSIETSELLSKLLEKENIPHQVLNAKQHEREALIVAQAGRPGTVTIATNMAGRGTDIVLGGNLEVELQGMGEVDEATQARVRDEWKQRHEAVLAAGGLHIVGTERHESRRIDNQLRGRSGRQGDAGSSRFYLSLEDNLMRIFGDPERVKRWLQTAGMKEGEVIESRMLSKQIERAQRKVEAHNFDARKNLLEYDDVANDQRKVIYAQRTDLMAAEEVGDAIAGIRHEVVNALMDRYVTPGSLEEQWDLEGLKQAVEKDFAVGIDPKAWLEADTNLVEEGLRKRVHEIIDKAYEDKVEMYGAPVVRHIEKAIMLQQLDSHWREHLAAMDYLRQGIHLRSYAQKNPKQEYKREAFELFTAMLDRIKHDTVSMLSRMQLRTQADVEREEREEAERQARLARALQFQHAAPEQLTSPTAPAEEPQPMAAASGEPVAQFVRETKKVGRNELCPCGSGKKFKHCHGALAGQG